jgi:proteasome-associated ATPase
MSGIDEARSPRELASEITYLRAEVAHLRRRAAGVPGESRALEERLSETQARLSAVTTTNDRLAATLREARTQITTLKEEVDRLAQPPAGYGTFMAAHDDGTVDVFTGGRKMRCRSARPSTSTSSAAARKSC